MSARSFAVFMAALAVIALLFFGLLKKNESALALGEKAPARTLPRLSGDGSASLDQYRGKWVLVNFWASWCGPCRQESPDLQSFYRAHRGPHFTVLGIDSRDVSGDGRNFLREFGITYPQLRDPDGASSHDYGTLGFPENFLVSPAGKLVLIRRGPVDASYLDRYVAPRIGAGQARG